MPEMIILTWVVHVAKSA